MQISSERLGPWDDFARMGACVSDQSRLRLAARIDILEALGCGKDPSASDLATLRDLADEIITERDTALGVALAEVNRLRAEVAMLDRHIANAEKRMAAELADVAATPFEIDSLDPHGFYVYFLWGQGGELLYIGKSTNLLSRLGNHMGRNDRRRLVARISLVRCPDEATLARTEERLIRHYRPPLNVAGVA